MLLIDISPCENGGHASLLYVSEDGHLVQDMTSSLPTIDAVPVVHCKDCEHLEFSDFYGECGKGILGIVQPWDYCSRGERKDGAEDG